MTKWILQTLVIVLTVLSQCQAYKFFKQQIPNGEIVPHPCKANNLWRGVGHENLNGGGKRNAFGRDFYQNGKVWNDALCMMDSDGDGITNGAELGDPDCTWTPGTAPKFNAGLSHPGVCEPLDDPKCAGQNDFVDCSSEGFKCSAINETGTFVHEVRFPETEVPNVETTYMCMLFEFPSYDDFHIIANTPYLDNEDVMHHILIFGCDPEKNVSNKLNTPYPSNMRCDEVCNDIIGLWTVGSNGFCMHQDVGFRVGARGYRIAAIEMHWNNPLLRSDYKDSSGMNFYLTPNIRPYDAGVMMTGQSYLEIPPGQYSYSTDGGCPGACTSTLMDGPVYVMEAFNHMHYLGAAQRTRLVRNRQSFDLAYDPVYSYDSPVIHAFDDPIVMNPGDHILTTCTYQSTSRTKTTYFGESTSAEMCFAFIIYYPKQNIRRTTCASHMSISSCEWWSREIQGCNIQQWSNPSDPDMAAMYARVWENCAVGTCKAECMDVARELKKHPCLSGDMTKMMRNQIEERQDVNELMFYGKIDSCNAELAQEQCPTCRDDGTGMVDSAGELRMGLTIVFAVLLGKCIL